ncbi:MAG TPA: hypothetical protein VFS20_05670 [Longimicrobium sp.]|nr:hypothetical protein [Longimicrobium sp.]
MDADSRGWVYVSDWMQQRVTVLSSDGRVLRRLGRSGAGPGEFRRLCGVQVLPGDSVLACDPELARLTVFQPESLGVARMGWTAR